MLAASGCCASLTSDVWNRPIANLVETFARAGRWWTGEDSNLRSPQGAADLQSAGFSHSPTRPAKGLDTTVMSLKHSQSRTGLRYGIAAMQKRLVSADTSPSAFVARNPSVCCKNPDPSEPQLAEGF